MMELVISKHPLLMRLHLLR